jgi:hypothetical protein
MVGLGTTNAVGMAVAITVPDRGKQEKGLLKADRRANLATRPLPEPESRPWVKQVGVGVAET